MSKWHPNIVLFVAALLLFSCNNAPSANHGPILLGDSATIVTEKDPQRLQDLVTDLQPTIPENKDTVTPAAKEPEKKPEDTAKKVAAEEPQKQQPQTQPTTIQDVNGLKAEFKDVTVMIPGLNAKIAGNPNLQRANGAVYSYTAGNINGSLLKVAGTVTKVSMRYQSVLVLKNDMGTLPLETLSSTTDWEQMKGLNNIYHITGLDERSLDRAEGNRNVIQNAVKKAAQRRRMSRRKVEEWVSSVRNVHSTGQKPLSVMLRSVMFKIDGKDANGRMFSKQVRIDVPL